MLRKRVAPARGAAPELAGPAHPLHALDQLRGDAEGDDDGHAELVEGAGQDPQGPLRVGQRVGRAEAAQQRAQPQPVVEGGDRPLQGDRAAELHAGRPRGQRDVRQGEEHVHGAGVDVAAEDRTEDHPDGDDGQRQVEVVLERPGPRRLAATVGHHDAEHAEDEHQQERIGGRCSRPWPAPGPRSTRRPGAGCAEVDCGTAGSGMGRGAHSPCACDCPSSAECHRRRTSTATQPRRPRRERRAAENPRDGCFATVADAFTILGLDRPPP